MLSSYTSIQRNRMNAILREVLRNKCMTRTELSEVLALSQSSVTKYVKQLSDIGLLRESSNTTETDGRRSPAIEVNCEIRVNITVVFTVSSIRAALVDFGGTVIYQHSVSTYKFIPKEQEMDKLYSIIEHMVNSAAELGRTVFAVGVAIGGYINPVTGVSHEFLYATNWQDVPIRDLLQERFSLPAFILNDVNAFALGEQYYGHGIGIPHFIVVEIDEGIGLSIVVNGELYLGANSYSGEFGHVAVEGNETLCYCGHSGCLETITNQNYILEKCKEGVRKGVITDISKLADYDMDKLRIEHVTTAANRGDRYACNVLDEVGRSIGSKLSDIVNVLNPQRIIFRGCVIDGNEFLFNVIRTTVMSRVLRHIGSALDMKYSSTFDGTDFKGVGSAILMDFFSGREN